jgi:hypothetical protein
LRRKADALSPRSKYAETLRELLRAKVEQRAPQIEVATEGKAPREVINIMTALKESMQAKGRAKVRDAVRGTWASLPKRKRRGRELQDQGQANAGRRIEASAGTSSPQLAFFVGTFLPFLRASESPIAIACLRLLTVPPFPPLPLFNWPRLNLCISRSTSSEALREYFLAMTILQIIGCLL